MEFLIIFLTATAPANPLTISAGRGMWEGRVRWCGVCVLLLVLVARH